MSTPQTTPPGAPPRHQDATDVEVRPTDPERARPLLEASQALMRALFNPEENHFLSIAELQRPEVRFFGAWQGEALLACGALARREGYGEIKSMFTAPEARGRGLAAAVLRRIEAEARAQGLPLLRLETGTGLDAAHALYRGFGFRDRGPFGDYAANGTSIFMEKALD